LDLQSLHFIGGGIELGDYEVRDVLHLLAELLPDRGESLAMAAPGSVVLHEDVLSWIIDNFVECCRNNDFDWARVVFRDFLGLEMRFELAILVVLDELFDLSHCHFLDGVGEDVLVHLI